MEKVRVRIAPSPTGYVHVGNTYNAYYSSVFARKSNGIFIVRLDDTDLDRHVEDAESHLYDLWTWFGLSWDEGADKGGPYAPYIQSQRLDRYRSVVEELTIKGLAYLQDGAVYLKVGEGEPVEFDDLIRGHIVFQRENLKDFVILKSNGYPTYQFATVVDEIDHHITHVIRAEDHLTNTASQLLVYNAMDATPPLFAHLPLLRNPDQSKLSKRHGHTSLQWYRAQGFLPEALKNFFALMGWSHPEGKEIFPEEEFVELFSFDRINKSAPVFDLQKLEWMNGMYIRDLSVDELTKRILEYVQLFQPEYLEGLEKDSEYTKNIIRLEQERITTLGMFAPQTDYFFVDPVVPHDGVFEFIPDKNQLKHYLNEVKDALTVTTTWDAATLETVLRGVQEKMSLKPKQAFMVLRIVISGKTATPSLFHMIEVLPKQTVIARIETFKI